jgi:hypothetical protein
MTKLSDENPQSSSAQPSLANRVVDILQVAAGFWLLAAFICMFFTEQFPFLKPVVMWTFRVYAGSFIALILGAILFSVLYGARSAVRIYSEVMKMGRFGIIGRMLWAIWFVIAFVIALSLKRW